MAITLDDCYFGWLCEQVDGVEYHAIMIKLYSTPFAWSLPLDQNREVDGLELRYHFGESAHIDPIFIEYNFCQKPCSMLEMMVALSYRIEREFMAVESSNRVGHWFWNMVDSLGLLECKDEKEADEIIKNFILRTYEPNGKGSLFYIPDIKIDMRELQIWDQMNHWLVWQTQIRKGE